uniref:Uncharacterized protein n=1 Tax=Arundo donax TaxID=35708 RepID=A0A0A8YAH6_ARUDO
MQEVCYKVTQGSLLKMLCHELFQKVICFK